MPLAISQAWRSWKSAPGLAALAAIAFAVGIGSVTAIYTVVRGVMLKPLPYAQGERFVALFGGTVNSPAGRSSHSIPDLLEYQQRSRSFDVIGWFRLGSFIMTSGGQTQHVLGASVTTSLAHNLGVQPRIGRWFDDGQGAVISSTLWGRLGAEPSIIGKPVTLDGRTFTVTGVMPPGSQYQGPALKTSRATSGSRSIHAAVTPAGCRDSTWRTPVSNRVCRLNRRARTLHASLPKSRPRAHRLGSLTPPGWTIYARRSLRP
jgi:hypothetical protein